MDLKRALTGGLAGLALVAGTTGCGKLTEKATEKATEKIAESASGCEDIDIDVDGGGASGTCDGQQFDGSATGSADLPDGWPEELTPPEGAQITVATGSAATGEFGYTATVAGTVAEVLTDVRTTLEAAGYTIGDTTTADSTGANAGTISASDDAFDVNVSVGETGATEAGTVVLIWSLTAK